MRGSAERIELPEAVENYGSEAAPDGVIGGAEAERLASDVVAELAKRGTSAVPDGALAGAATWVLREANSGKTSLSYAGTDAAARRYGFVGALVSFIGFPIDGSGDEQWRKALALVPPNMPINRFGISVSKSGRSAAVAFGAVEMTAEPFPRHLQVNASLELRGEVSARYDSAHVYLTKPDGSVTETRVASRKVQTTIGFPAAGKYKVEVMGDGATGPVIVFNVPVYVGVPEEDPSESTGRVTSPAEGEARMLELLNQGRKAAGFSALQPDDELREIALAHSTDMVEHHFFGHVSPSTGTTEDRYHRSGAIVAAFGENVAQADTAENSYDGLMASPGHRANMQNPRFTRVGIAAVSTDEHQLAFTMIFGRRSNPALMPQNAAQVEAAIVALRAKKGVSAPVPDVIYRAAADAGVAAYVAAATPSTDIATRAHDAALQSEVQRLRSSRPANCSLLTEIVELEQLEQTQILQNPLIHRFGRRCTHPRRRPRSTPDRHGHLRRHPLPLGREVDRNQSEYVEGRSPRFTRMAMILAAASSASPSSRETLMSAALGDSSLGFWWPGP